MGLRDIIKKEQMNAIDLFVHNLRKKYEVTIRIAIENKLCAKNIVGLIPKTDTSKSNDNVFHGERLPFVNN